MEQHSSARQSRGGRPRRLSAVTLAVLGMTVIAVAIVIYPLFPRWKFAVAQWWRGNQNLPAWATLSEQRTPEQSEAVTVNKVIIPKIGVESEIVEGETEAALNRGTWRIPSTSTPDQGGNTVLSGHRFRFLPPNNTTFYLLDKLNQGDEIFVWWDGVLYTYRVVESRVVNPDAVEILDPTADDRLTIFTCTPLLSTDRRLVVSAVATSGNEAR